MSWYSINALVVLRSLEQFVRDQFNKLNKRLDQNNSTISGKLDDLAIHQMQLDVDNQKLVVVIKDSFDIVVTHLNEQKVILDELLALQQKQTTTLSVIFKFEDGKIINSLGGLQMKITDIQSVSATASETDAKGNPVILDPTKLTWASSDPTKVSVTQNPDGSVKFSAVGPLTALPDGTDPGVQVSVTDGNLTQVDFIQVTNSAGTTLGINFGQPA